MITIFDSESPFFSSGVCDTSGVGSEPDKDSETNQPIHPMTQNEFIALCAELTIDPALALESFDVCDALMSRDPEAIRDALIASF